MNKPIKPTTELDIGGINESGGVIAPFKKDKDGSTIVDTGKARPISPDQDYPDIPEGYDGWIKISNN